MNLSNWKKFRLRNYDAKYIFSLCFLQYSVLYVRYIKVSLFAGEKMWFLKAFVKRNVRYTERIYKTCVRIEKREMDFGS